MAEHLVVELVRCERDLSAATVAEHSEINAFLANALLSAATVAEHKKIATNCDCSKSLSRNCGGTLTLLLSQRDGVSLSRNCGGTLTLDEDCARFISLSRNCGGTLEILTEKLNSHNNLRQFYPKM